MPKFQPPRREDIKAITRRLGALERRGIRIIGQKRFLHSALGDGLGLFYAPSLFEITAVKRRFEELGLTDLLDPPPEPEYEDDAIFGRVTRLERPAPSRGDAGLGTL